MTDLSQPSQSELGDQFAHLVERFAGVEGVIPPGATGSRGFGTSDLRVHGAIFAMLVRGHLVVKLPRDRVDALVEGALATRFDANRGRPMKEWAVLVSHEPNAWAELADESLQFVRSIATAQR